MKVTTPSQAWHLFKERMQMEVEELWVAALNSEKEVLELACLFRGTVDRCIFHPRDVFRFAYQHNAAALVVAHNHPSGNSHPSPEDREVTSQLLAAARILQIPVVDHLIVTKNAYYSFFKEGELAALQTDAAVNSPAWPVDP